MKKLNIYGVDEAYLSPDRGSFVHQGKAWRPKSYIVWVNTHTGVATIDYTVVALRTLPMVPDDFWHIVDDDTMSGQFVYRIDDGYSCGWINECVLEDLIASHVLGTLENPIGDRERDLKVGLIPHIGTQIVLGIKREYAIADVRDPVVMGEVTLYGRSGNRLVEEPEFWTAPGVEVLRDAGNPNYAWIDQNVRQPSATAGSCPM